MLDNITKTVSTALLLGALTFGGATAALAQNVAHAHIGHVTEGWGDTPDGKGLLPTAIAEAEIALVHADLAADKPDNLDWMKAHSLHVLHAVDSSAIDAGPGLGYGVRQAAEGVVKHIGFAAAANEATENVKLHTVHVATSAQNTVTRASAVVDLVSDIQAASTAADAAPMVAELLVLVTQLLDGHDANGDGTVSWHENEGGLREADKHMGFMRAGEDL